jgi:hypothetical protein
MPALFARLGLAKVCSDEHAGAAAVQSVAAAGMDHVKLVVMHQSYGNRPLPAVTAPVARAIVAEAHRLGLRVLAHAHGVADYDVALGAGVDALMHSSFEPLDDVLVARVRDAGVPVGPTLWVFESVCLGAEMRFDREPRFLRHVAPYIQRSWRRFAEAYAESGEVGGRPSHPAPPFFVVKLGDDGRVIAPHLDDWETWTKATSRITRVWRTRCRRGRPSRRRRPGPAASPTAPRRTR